MEEDCTSLIIMLDIVYCAHLRWRFCVQNANGKFSVNKSRPGPSSRPSQILLTVFICLFQEIFQAYFGWSGKHALAVILTCLMHLAVRNMIGLLTWRRLFFDRLHAERCGVMPEHFRCCQQSRHIPTVHDLTINATVLKLSRLFKEYFDHF